VRKRFNVEVHRFALISLQFRWKMAQMFIEFNLSFGELSNWFIWLSKLGSLNQYRFLRTQTMILARLLTFIG
jgi:hypothetical protein